MTDKFIELTKSEEGQPAGKVLVNLRAIACVETNTVDPGSLIFFSHMEEDYIAVVEGYDQVSAAIWTRPK
jgi:hypothetical protein